MPECKLTPMFVTIDTKQLHALYVMEGKKPGLLAKFYDDRDKWWNDSFKLQRVLMKARKFKYIIFTDGVSVCVKMTKTTSTTPAPATSSPQPPPPPPVALAIPPVTPSPKPPPAAGAHVVGLDPGRRDVFVASEVVGTSDAGG